MIRAGSAADAAQVAAVQREGWFAAYDGIIPGEIIDQVTAPDDGARVRQSFRTRPWQRMIVAMASGANAGVIGYASFGPETEVLSAPWPHPLSTDGADGRVAELYALYVRPAWWSTGTGRALMERVLARSAGNGYSAITLWVLRDNRRARRFYERAGFAPDGATNVLTGLGNVIELRYRRSLESLAEQQEGLVAMTDAREIAATYFEAWRARDFARLRSVLADDVDFAGPLARVRGGDDCLRGLRGMAQITTGLEVRKVFHDGPDVLTWFDLATSVAETVPVANWMHVEDGKITRIRVAFDARGIAAGS